MGESRCRVDGCGQERCQGEYEQPAIDTLDRANTKDDIDISIFCRAVSSDVTRNCLKTCTETASIWYSNCSLSSTCNTASGHTQPGLVDRVTPYHGGLENSTADNMRMCENDI